MKLLIEHEYKKWFEKIKPYLLIAPFGLNWNYNPPTSCMVITKKDYLKDFKHKNFKLKTYQNMHAKLAIGDNALLVGSWNWSLTHDTAARTREIVIMINKNTPLYEELIEYFGKMWNAAHGVEEWLTSHHKLKVGYLSK